MVKKLTFIALPVLITGILLSFFLSKTSVDERDLYDQQLSESFKEAQNQLKGHKADHPDHAAMQNFFMIQDPEIQQVPSDRLVDAYRYAREQKQALHKSTSELDWTEVSSNMGGRTRAILWDPNDPAGNKVWAGGVTGGLWYRENIYDNSSEWTAVNDFWPSLSVSCITYDPLDPLIFYLGTGEYQTARDTYRESSGVGIGIWKSVDGGQSWEILPGTEDFKYIADLKVRIEEGISILYAGVVSGYYHGINHQSNPTDGLYRSQDGGVNWEQVLPDIPGQSVPFSPADLEIGPDGRIYVGTMKNLDGEGGAAILFSDEGTPDTWTVFNDYEAIIQADPDYYIPGRVMLACAPSDASRVYALVGAGWNNSYGFNLARGRYILKSDDGGESWSEANLPGGGPDWASLSWHAFIAAVNPTDPDEIFVGGLDVWKSTNAGNSWLHLSDWAGMYWGGGDDYVHADQHVQLYKPGSSTEMVFGTDGGVFYTDNATAAFPDFQEKNQNYSTLQFYSIDIYPLPGQNYLVGGLQDNGTLLYMGEALDINDMIDGGDGAYCFFDENEPAIMITSTYYNSYTLFYNWSYYTDMGDYGTGVFVNPADYDSENNILYANGVNFNGNYGNRILRITGIPDSPYDQLINLNLGLNTYFSSVKVSPYAPEGTSTLFLGSQNGRLFRVENAHSSPSTAEIGSDDFPTAYLACVAIGGSEDTLMAVFSNYGVPSVWQTHDGGENWYDISGNLPDMPIRWGIFHPQDASQIMLATEVGIWTTNNALESEITWEPDPGMPNVRVDMLQMRTIDNTVAAATHGRGMMYTTWDYNPSTGVQDVSEQAYKIYPNPAYQSIQIDGLPNEEIRFQILSVDGKIVREDVVLNNNAIDISDLEKGVYFLRLENVERIGSLIKLIKK